MKVVKSLLPYQILVSVPNTAKMYRLTDENNIVIALTEGDQRELLIWFRNNKPELMREIFCEECPEHMEYANYCENKAERGK